LEQVNRFQTFLSNFDCLPAAQDLKYRKTCTLPSEPSRRLLTSPSKVT